MKFWLTIVIGVMVVAMASTALLTMTPNVTATTTDSAPAEPEKPDPNRYPVAEIVSPREFKRPGLGQNQKGREVFRLRNASPSVKMEVTALQPTCHCTQSFLADHEYGPTENHPGDEKRKVANVDPGKEIFVIVDWDTKDKLGEQRATVPIKTDDPHNRTINFTIEMQIQKELMASAGEFAFGTLNEREAGEGKIKLTSLIRDKIVVESMDYDRKLYSVTSEVISKDELARSGAKAGVTFTAKALGKHPVGSFMDMFSAWIVTPHGKEKAVFRLVGTVVGDIVVDPESTILDFREVTKLTNAPISRNIFVRKAKPGETFKLGAVKPEDTITVSLEKSAKGNWYKLVARVKPTAPAGKIEGGYIAVVDDSGRERITFRAVGFVDPQLSQRTAAVNK